MFPRRGVLVDWQKPVVPVHNRTKNEKPVVVFPASTVGRKGCYELRVALEGLNVKLIRLGPDIEDEGFWNGFDTIRGDKNAIESADVVVLPAFVEHRPRKLIHAAAWGVPVIASAACGLKHVSGVETIEASDTNILRQKILQAISS
jgi:glycosyltransferase involved in cell wall biosynthesis